MRLLLITPPYHSGVVESAGVWMPLHFVYLAGHARAAGAEVRILDAMSLQMSHDDIVREIEDWRPTMVGTTAITAMEPDARELCRNAKAVDPNIVTVLGNVHPTYMWHEILSAETGVDVIVRGEGEITLAELVTAVGERGDLSKVSGIALRQDGVPMATRPRGRVKDLDALIPAWDLIDWPKYSYRPSPEGQLAIVSSSRGCLQHCTFCSQQQFWEKTWRSRSPLSFVQELEMLRDRFGVRVAMLSDETPTPDRDRWERILDLLIERQAGVELLLETRVVDIVRDEDLLGKYRDAGISHIYVGVESTDQATLDLYQKGTETSESKRAIDLINQHEMVSETSFVLGLPHETQESIEHTVELAKWYGPDMAFFLAITPWPYTELWNELEDHVATGDFRRYNLVEPVVKPESMSLEAMQGALHRATGEFFKDKFHRLGELSPEKRRFMISVLKLLIEHSYLGEQMRAMASGHEMPLAVRRMLADLEIQPEDLGLHGGDLHSKTG